MKTTAKMKRPWAVTSGRREKSKATSGSRKLKDPEWAVNALNRRGYGTLDDLERRLAAL